MLFARASLVALVVLLPALLAAVPAEAGTSRTLTISTASAKPKVAFKAFDAAVKLYDLNGDGRKEIIAHNDNRYVYVFDSKTGALRAELTTKYPSPWGARPLNPPEAAKFGGKAHLVIVNSAAYVTLFRYDGLGADGRFKMTKVWDKRLSDCGGASSDSKATIADLDKDGMPEILAQTEEVGVFALRATGSVMWKKCIGGGNGEPSVGDLDGDGGVDVVFPSDGGALTAVDGPSGKTKWTKWLAGAMPVGPTIAQLDGKGGADVVIGVRDKRNCTDFSQNHMVLWALSGSGSTLWKRQENFSNPLTYTHPVVADVDGNGQKDVVMGDWNTQGHKCGAWNRTGPANYVRYDAAGNLRWRLQLNTMWSNKDLSVGDVDGDGGQEVLINGMNGGSDGIWYVNARTGAKETFVSTWPWKVTRGAVLEDLWRTGTMQWVVSAYAYGNGSSGGAILVYNTGVPFKALWPHLPYPP